MTKTHFHVTGGVSVDQLLNLGQTFCWSIWPAIWVARKIQNMERLSWLSTSKAVLCAIRLGNINVAMISRGLWARSAWSVGGVVLRFQILRLPFETPC